MNNEQDKPFSFGGKKKKSAKPAGGWTKADYSVRCPKCSVGVGEGGVAIGTLVSAQIVSMQVDAEHSVAVAKMARCINLDCGYILHMTLTKDAERMGIKAFNILQCVKKSNGNLFYPEELRAGAIRNSEHAPVERKEAPVEVETVIKDPFEQLSQPEPLF
jgi:hypothetical protein